jgi:opacity protein-like surface antigen
MKQLLIASLLISTVANQAYAAKFIPAANTNTAAGSTSTAQRTPAAAPDPLPYSAPAWTIAAAETAPARPVPAAPTRPAPSAASNSGMYIGAQLGDSSVGALLGYQISRMFSMEISYDYVDPVYGPTTKQERSRAGASGLAMFPLKFSEMGPMAIYIKVGYGRSTEKFTVNDPGSPPLLPATTSVTTTSTTGVTGGAGIHVDLSSSASVRLGFNVVGSDKSTYLAAMYKF